VPEITIAELTPETVAGAGTDAASAENGEAREPVPTNGHANGDGRVNGNGSAVAAKGSLSTPAASPAVPPTEAPVHAPAASQLSTAPVQSAPAAMVATSQVHGQARPAEEQMVVLEVGEEAYGIPVQRVREIIRVPPITRVPNGPAFLEGVINLRGQVIPVMDLRKHLGIPAGAETRRSRVVVSELGRHAVGLRVDGVSQVVMVTTSEIEPPPSLLAGANDGQVRGVARLGDKLVLFLDPDRMLPER
jgi:purine-binding chemotaxis protein CheW